MIARRSRGPATGRLAVAGLVDLLAGEPPAAIHPVVWIGRLARRLLGRGTGARRGPGIELARGALVVGTTLGIVTALASVAEAQLRALGPGRGRPAAGFEVGLTALVAGVALKPSFAIRALFRAVEQVERDLARDDLAGARASAGRIVSRDTRALDASLLAAAAIESLAENASDSVVAPLLCARLVGLPGAYAYRAINTLDAMVGYRGEYEYLGKAAARLDDLANLVPARLTALLIALAAPVVGTNPVVVLGRLPAEARRTASPNAGWPMAAAALALRVRLEKRGHYALNPTGRGPDFRDIARARRLVAAALAVGGIGLAVIDRLAPSKSLRPER